MSSAEDARLAGRLSIAYLMAIVGEVLRTSSLDFVDLLLVTAIANVNRSTQPQLTHRRGAKPSNTGFTGISRNAVSRSLNMPLETVRRRIAGLIEKGVLVEQSDGLAFSAHNSVGLGDNPALHAFNLAKLRELFKGLRALGIELE